MFLILYLTDFYCPVGGRKHPGKPFSVRYFFVISILRIFTVRGKQDLKLQKYIFVSYGFSSQGFDRTTAITYLELFFVWRIFIFYDKSNIPSSAMSDPSTKKLEILPWWNMERTL